MQVLQHTSLQLTGGWIKMHVDITRIYEWAWENKKCGEDLERVRITPCEYVWGLATFCATEHLITFTRDDKYVEYYNVDTETWENYENEDS